MTAVLPVLRTGPLARVNPVAKLGAALLPGLVLVASIDWVSALTALGAELALLLFAGLPWRALALRLLPILTAAPLVAVTTVLYGQASGTVFLRWGVIEVTQGSVDLGIATGLRVLAIGVPAVALFATVDPTDLADGLAQVLRLPARFVLGALAALRLVGLLVDDWRQLALARRARGVADRGRVTRMLGQVFALLVLSLRRGGSLATAMEARGFGARTARTWARPSPFGAAEWALVGLGLVVAACAVAVSVTTGSWNFVLA